ncbi:tripartite tricarboxylate transporter substrate-binding protein [Histidinibacterium lentulum]|nr:tripartite tricarboxylate transporter substrate-binding protein [Histidinibacterium lentulum]
MGQTGPGPAALDAARTYLEGRTVRAIIPSAAGSGTDRSSRLFISALEPLLPRTRFRVENNDRAGGQIGASELWRGRADGTVIGFPRNNLFYAQLMERDTLDFSFSDFTFFGSVTRGHRVLVLGTGSSIDGVEEILAGRRIVLKSADSVTSSHFVEAMLMNALSGSRIRPVPGFSGGSRNMAVISGEVDCQIGSIEAVQPIVESGAGRIVFRLTSDPLPEGLPEVPRLADHLRDPGLEWAVGIIDAAADLGRPFAGPPGMAPEVAAHWTALFEAVVGDAGFREKAFAEEGVVIDPAPAGAIAARLGRLSSLGDGLRDEVDALLGCGRLLAESTEGTCG